eukprot:SAG31_NODE_3655_length_4020_cov_15.839582_1_plen_197_part_00
MVVAQVFLNLAPLGACVFVTFFGRMFAELLRLLINFFIVVAPLLVSRRPMLRYQHLIISQNISEHLRISQNISEYLRTSQNISEHLRISQNISQLFFEPLFGLIAHAPPRPAPLQVSSLQEQLDGTTEVLTPVALMGSMWSVLAGVGVSYLCAKRPAFAKKIETVGVSFLCVLVLNSFYLGLLHGKVRHHAAAVVT